MLTLLTIPPVLTSVFSCLPEVLRHTKQGMSGLGMNYSSEPGAIAGYPQQLEDFGNLFQ